MYIIDEENGLIEMTYSVDQTFNRVMIRSQYKAQSRKDGAGMSAIHEDAITLSDADVVKQDIKDSFALAHGKMVAYTKDQEVPFSITDDEVVINVAPAVNWDWGHVIQLDQTIINTVVLGALQKWYQMKGDENNAIAYSHLFEAALSNVKSSLEKRKAAPQKGYHIF